MYGMYARDVSFLCLEANRQTPSFEKGLSYIFVTYFIQRVFLSFDHVAPHDLKVEPSRPSRTPTAFTSFFPSLSLSLSLSLRPRRDNNSSRRRHAEH